DGAAGLTHVLDSAGVTVTVDGVAWTTDSPAVRDTFSYLYAGSPEYTVTKPATTTYTVSFNANGGTGTMADVTGVAAGAYTLPANGFTAPAGKQFKGWATSATGEVIATATYNVTGNVTFYAIWENIPVTTYTVSFNANGGTGTMADVTGVTAGAYTLPANGFTAPAGKQFKGWATSENGEVIATATYNVTGNVTFYAIWENIPVTTYTVSFNANGGTGEMAAVTGVAAGAYTLPTNGFTAPEGKQFKGWATSATGEVIATATYNVTGNVTFYAIWENIPVTTYTVSFNANGGTGEMADVTGVTAGEYTLPANGFTAPAGKQFKGWATSATGEVIATATYNVTGNVTFYAIWENIYTITFDANGGTGEMAAVTGVTAGEYTLPANGFTAPSCKKFKGWATSENGEVIATATYNVTGNVTFYAIWEDDPAAHNYGTEWYKNSEKHWHECAVCHTKKDEAPHVYDNDCDTTCNVCGAVREITHNYAEVWSNDENNHWHECTVCHTRKDEAAHVPGPEATEETAQVCTVCGYVLKAPLGHTHKPKLVEKVEPTCTENGNIAYYRCHCGKLYYDSAATREITDLSKIVLFSKGHVRCHEWHTTVLYHWQECTVCNERIDTAFHRPGADATETTPQTCPVCGYVLKEALGHTHKFDQKNTDAKYLKSAANCNSGAVYYYSCACGEKGTETFVSGEKLNHTFKTEWSTDENNHWHECSLCGTVKDKAAHTFEWKIDKKPTAGEAGSKHEECTVCGYKKDAVIIEPTGTTTTTPPAVTTTEGKAEIPEKSGAAWVWAIVAVVVLGGGAAVVIVLVRKKKKA
ncbi:MAG: InlB B-repeat-containing protein, partial [Eubacterium sp.]|nr:InlB B-repeat-containing protein [Eubacterium sp.]